MLEVFNIFDADVSDIDYFYASRLVRRAGPGRARYPHASCASALRVVRASGRVLNLASIDSPEHPVSVVGDPVAELHSAIPLHPTIADSDLKRLCRLRRVVAPDALNGKCRAPAARLTVKVLPAIVIVPIRASPVFAATVKLTDPDPVRSPRR